MKNVIDEMLKECTTIEEKFNLLIQMSGDTIVHPLDSDIKKFNSEFMKWIQKGIGKEQIKLVTLELLSEDNFYNVYIHDNTKGMVAKKFIADYSKEKMEKISYKVSGQGLKDTITMEAYKIGSYLKVKFCDNKTVLLSKGLDTLAMYKKHMKSEEELWKNKGKH